MGGMPGVNDEVILDNRATDNMRVTMPLVIGKLSAAANFNKTLRLDSSLTINMNAARPTSAWETTSGINLKPTGSLNVKGAGVFTLSAGYIWVGGLAAPPAGSISVTDGATMKWTQAFTSFAANITVGAAETTGTVELSNLNDAVTSYAASNILVTPNGTFRLAQTGNTADKTRGGIKQDDGLGVYGTFTNQGNLIREGETTGPYSAELDYVVTNTGVFKVQAFQGGLTSL